MEEKDENVQDESCKDEPEEVNDKIEEEIVEKQKRPGPILVLLRKDGGIVVEKDLIDELHEKSYFGSIDEETGLLFLYPEEIMIFSERNRLIAIKEEDFSINECLELLQEIKIKWENGATKETIFEDPKFMNDEKLFEYFNKYIPDFWEKYVVYRDLKTRGYIVRRGIENISHFRVFKKGAKKGSDSAKYIYFGVFEGKPISLLKLHEISDYAMNNRKELILATIDRLSDITYYSVKKQEL
ncbi:MAG: tRNA-intron lyase [Promethearchaeota archaeon]